MTTSDVFDQQSTFADLGLRNSLLLALDEAGFEYPTFIQSQMIPVMMSGRDVMGQAKTGTGKTAAFALPILHHADKDTPGQALVLAPTRELAIQIVAEIKEFAHHTPIKVAAVVGGESFQKQRKAIEGGAQIIVGTPGRIMDLQGRGQLSFDRIRWAVLDEVDRMLDIGFRDDIRKILGKIKGTHQTVFVSATISDEIERLARRFMTQDAERITVEATSLTVSQVTQHYIPVRRGDKKALLHQLLTTAEPALTVVFCRMKVTVREVTEYLKKKGVEAYEIHGDMPQAKRNRIMKRLREGNLEVLIASDLAARGLDVEGISHVINYDLPEDPEIYVHRIGRTARAGRSGVAWTFVEPGEGQRQTEVEKLTGVLMDRLEFEGFDPPKIADHPPQPRAQETPGAAMGRRAASQAPPEADPSKFPGGVVPKGPPSRGLGGRIRRRRR